MPSTPTPPPPPTSPAPPPPSQSAAGRAPLRSALKQSSSTPAPPEGSQPPPPAPSPSGSDDSAATTPHNHLHAEAHARHRVRAARAALEFRRDNAEYFSTARTLGPQVFTDPVPLALNALVVLFAGNVVLFAPPTWSVSNLCPAEPALWYFLFGHVVASYLLLALLGWFTLRPQVVSHVRWPFVLLLAWCAGLAVWTFFGIGTVTTAIDKGCLRDAPVLLGLSLAQLAVPTFLAAAMLLKWFAKGIWRGAKASWRFCCGRQAWWRANRNVKDAADEEQEELEREKKAEEAEAAAAEEEEAAAVADAAKKKHHQHMQQQQHKQHSPKTQLQRGKGKLEGLETTGGGSVKGVLK
jgi:hypothetical protein